MMVQSSKTKVKTLPVELPVENVALEKKLPTDGLWVVTGPGPKTKLIEAPTWYLARERFGGASPLLCEAFPYEGIGELRHVDGYEWDVIGTTVSG